MLHGIDRACSQLYEALLDGDGVEALLQLESEVHKHVGGRANEGESGTG
jgi:hypothetical protein